MDVKLWLQEKTNRNNLLTEIYILLLSCNNNTNYFKSVVGGGAGNCDVIHDEHLLSAHKTVSA